MSTRDSKRYYWLKLHKDFFDRHDIKVIEDMPNGKEYVLFLVKLMAESVSHDGALRFSDAIPYSPEMLASVTHTNVDIVRSALRLFGELGLVEIMNDETLYVSLVERMIGSETGAARRKRVSRATTKQLKAPSADNVHDCPENVHQSKSKSKSKSKEVIHPVFDVPMNQTRYETLCEKHGKSVVDWAIESRLDWEGTKGKPAARDYAAAAANWIKRADEYGNLPVDNDGLNPYRPETA